MHNDALLHIDNLRKFYPVRSMTGKKAFLRAVDGVSFAIQKGETLGIVGESGCGKTSLGRTILRLVEPDGGTIYYDGKDITRVSMRPYRQRMQIIFQDPSGSLDPKTRIGDSVAEGLRIKQPDWSAADRKAKVADLLVRVGLSSDLSFRFPHELSGGQQQRVGIARALAVEPEFIVCDEPLSALDVSYQSRIIRLLEDVQNMLELTYLFISHDLTVVQLISNKIAVMYLGKLVEYGMSNDIISSPAHPYTKELLEAIPVPDLRINRTRKRRPLREAVDLSIPEYGCRYSQLCECVIPRCFQNEPELREISSGHSCACHLSNL